MIIVKILIMDALTFIFVYTIINYTFIGLVILTFIRF